MSVTAFNLYHYSDQWSFLEKYYVSKKVEVLEEAKEVLSQMNLDDILQYDTDIEEDKKGQQMRFRMRLRGAVPEITLPGS